jgi:hypothetical protein
MSRLFYITMNMQSRSGNPTHQIVGSVDGVDTLEDFLRLIEGNEFIIVDEHYRKPEGGGYFSNGRIVINSAHIGKVKLSS